MPVWGGGGLAGVAASGGFVEANKGRLREGVRYPVPGSGHLLPMEAKRDLGGVLMMLVLIRVLVLMWLQPRSSVHRLGHRTAVPSPAAAAAAAAAAAPRLLVNPVRGMGILLLLL